MRLHPLGVRAREQQQVADEPPHAPRRAQRRVRRLGLLAVELLGEQLEVREHARQRRPQLVRRVGDELALARQARLGLAAGGVQRPEHPLERPRKLGDLVVGLGVGDPPARVPGALDLARRIGQLDDRPHRALRGRKPGQQREEGPAEHAEQQEQAHVVERLVDLRQRPRVQQHRRVDPFTPTRAGDHPVAQFVERAGLRRHLERGRDEREAPAGRYDRRTGCTAGRRCAMSKIRISAPSALA